MSGNIHKRWTAVGDRRHHKLNDLNSLVGVRLHYIKTRTRDAAERLEAIEIVRWKPPLNRKRERLHSWGSQDAIDWGSESSILGFVAFLGIMLLGILK